MSQFMHNYCAYHPNQRLTNFCTCVQCLLPVCPTCIKVHTDEHLQKGTHPQFQKLQSVLTEVYQSSSNIMEGLQRLKEELLEVQKVKKENESLILQKIKLYRNKLIREFERVLMQVEHSIVKRFKEEDENFIAQIQQVDMTIDKLEREVQSQMDKLEGEEGLRQMIFSLSQSYQIKCLKSLTGLNEKIKQMLKRNVYLEVEQDRIEDIKVSVMNYMKLGTIEWGINKPKPQSHANSHYPQQPNPHNQLTSFTQQNSFHSHKSINIKPAFSYEPQNDARINSSRTRVSNHYLYA